MNKLFPLRSIALVAILLAPSFAFADVVASKPTSCPSGTHLVTNHYGSDCAPDACPAPAQPNICDGRGCCKIELCQLPEGACEEGFSCSVSRLCATPVLPAPNDHYREITGSCEDGSPCPAGSTCEVIAACVRKKSVFSACSCDLAQKNQDSAAPLFACALAFAAFACRSSRRRASCRLQR